MSSDDTVLDMHEEAVAHARRANRAAYLGWRHLRSEYSQDMEFVLSTIETKGPWTWTLPLGGMAGAEDAAPGSTEAPPADGSEHLSYISATNMEEIREQYVAMRDAVQVWDWISMTDIRTGYYMITHGVARLKDIPTSEWFEVESVTMFPIGNDGILGEVQIGDFANERPGRWPEVPGEDGVVPLPINKLQASMLHNEYMDALRAEDVDRIVATFRPNTANAIRSYLTDDYTVLNAEGAEGAGRLLPGALRALRHQGHPDDQPGRRVLVHLLRPALDGGGQDGQTRPGRRSSSARPTWRRSTPTASSGCAPASAPTLCRQPRPGRRSRRPTATSAARRTCGAGSTTSSADAEAGPLRERWRRRRRPPPNR